MATTSLLDLIARADSFDPSTAWLLKHLGRNLPATASILKAKAEVLSDPIPEFRRAPGGLVKVGDHVVGNAHGNGYLDGRVERWPTLKATVFETLLGKDVCLPPVGKPLAKKAPKAKVAKKADAPKAVKAAARPATRKVRAAEAEGDDYLVCECCGRRVSYEEGLVRLGGKRICGKCAKAKHPRVSAASIAADAE